MDYRKWSLHDLELLQQQLATLGADEEEKTAVKREIERREAAAHPFPAPPAAGAGYHDTTAPAAAPIEGVGVAPRFVAQLIDGVVFFLLGLLVALFRGGTYTASTDGTHTAGFHLGLGGLLVVSLFGFVYYVGCEVLLGGTLGKRALGLRVVNEEGGQITWGASLLRNLMRIVDGLFFGLVGASAIWTSPTQQRFGDQAAHTYVVRNSQQRRLAVAQRH